MLRDDSGNGGGRPSSPRNVLGDRLDVCSMEPKTGFFRDGCCNTSREDVGSHTVCAVMTAEFLGFPNLAAMIFRRRCPNSAFPASGPATAGACVPPAGAKRWRRAMHPGWSCVPPTKAPSTTARSPISSVSPWTSPEFGHRIRRVPLSREYRDAFKLKSDYPLVAPAYAARRSDLAKSLGLGRKAGMMKVAAKKVSTKRGGRKAAAVA